MRLIRRMTPPLGWTLPELRLVAVVAPFTRGPYRQSVIRFCRNSPGRENLATHLQHPSLRRMLSMAPAMDMCRLFRWTRNGTCWSPPRYSPWTSAAEKSRARHCLTRSCVSRLSYGLWTARLHPVFRGPNTGSVGAAVEAMQSLRPAAHSVQARELAP